MQLAEYLERQLGHAYRQLAKTLEGVTAGESGTSADPQWRRYRFGTGLDGSIAGIVWHVAAWKHVIADGLEGGGFPDADAVLPHGSGWAGLQEWLGAGHARLARVYTENAAAAGWLEHQVVLEGEPLTIAELFTIVIEHDHYHAGQVNLLRQQMGHRFEA